MPWNVRFVPEADSCTAAKRPLAGLSFGCVRPHKLAARQAPGRLEGGFLTQLAPVCGIAGAFGLTN
jgi:hypothetical protein